MRPEDDAVLRAIPAIKERLQVNIELASPLDFIPVPSGWEDRSPPIVRIGRVGFHHFDLYAQALAKLERGHRRDVADVREMLGRGLVAAPQLLTYFERIEPDLYRYPAIDPPSIANPAKPAAPPVRGRSAIESAQVTSIPAELSRSIVASPDAGIVCDEKLANSTSNTEVWRVPFLPAPHGFRLSPLGADDRPR